MNYPKFIKPVDGQVSQWFRGQLKNDPQYYKRQGFPGHEGIDWSVPIGTMVCAVADGQVNEVHSSSDGAYGRYIRLSHLLEGECYQTIYAHLSETMPLRKGDRVLAGQVIGLSGNTGHSTGAHLHFTLKMLDARRRGLTDYPYDIIDPKPFFNW